MNKVVYVTGNQSKADYLARLLDVPLEHHKLDLDELQLEDPEALVEHKVRQAYEIIGRPVLVEDVSLHFDALGGLPGPFVKFFVEKPDGLERMCRMLDGFGTRTAQAVCTFGYHDGERTEFFVGKLVGVIANHPRGESGFGWDKIFCPEEYGGQTRAELGEAEDASTYATLKPVAALRRFFEELEDHGRH